MCHPTVLATLACAALSTSLNLPAQNHVVGWGSTFFDSRCVGGHYRKIAASFAATLQLRQDGVLFLRGDYAHPVPSLPPQQYYVDCAGGYMSIFAAVRSDGLIVKWGYPMRNPVTQQEYSIPALPSGLRYLQVAVGYETIAALRSDGELVVWGRDSTSLYAPPARPANTTFTKVSGGMAHFAALTADGQVFDWGLQGANAIQVPALPAGVTYSDIATGSWHSLYLRSDGWVEGVGNNYYGVIGKSCGSTTSASGSGTDGGSTPPLRSVAISVGHSLRHQGVADADGDGTTGRRRRALRGHAE